MEKKAKQQAKKSCAVTGKQKASGMNVSHSKRHTKRWFKPNLTKRTVKHPETGEQKSVYVSAKGWRTLKNKPEKVKELF